MDEPPEDETTRYTGGTSGTQEERWFFKRFVVTTEPLTNGLSVTVHMAGASKPAPPSGSGTYKTANWSITKARSPGTVYATSPGAAQSGNATVHFKKNRQVATWTPDYINCEYELSKKGPCSTHFDCSGLQGYMYNLVGYDYNRQMENAQTQYNRSTHISAANLLPGDWVFFDWNHSPPHGDSIDHTGMYEKTENGNKRMIHASSSAGKVLRGTVNEDYALYGHRYGANERF